MQLSEKILKRSKGGKLSHVPTNSNNTFNEVAGSKLNKKKSVAFIWKNSNYLEDIMEEKILFSIAKKKMK